MTTENHRRVAIAMAFVFGLLALTMVNYEAGSPTSMTPVTKSATRLVLGAILLASIGVALRLGLAPTRALLWRYAVVGMLNMAIPQALIFIARTHYGRAAVDVGVAEAAIPGVILVHMFTGGRRFSNAALAAVSAMLLGLFLFVAWGTDYAGWWLLLASAVCTGVGLVVDDKMRWADAEKGSPQVAPEWRQKVSMSLRKSMFSALISGAVSYLFVATMQATRTGSELLTFPSDGNDWWVVLKLAVSGTCVSWFAIFFLIQQGRLALLAAMIAAIPVVSACWDLANGKASSHSPLQWGGGAILIAALAALVYVELVKPRPSENKQNVQHGVR